MAIYDGLQEGLAGAGLGFALVGPVGAAIGGFSGYGMGQWQGVDQRRAAASLRNEQNTIALHQMANQREFAKHGIQWRVDDAKAAGIHPLAALGSPTRS